MKPITEKKRQALIAKCKKDIAEMRSWRDGDDYTADIEIAEIALYSLEAEPEYNAAKGFELHFGISSTFCDELQEDGYFCWVSYSAPPVPVMKPVDLSSVDRMLGRNDWIKESDVIAAIRAAGGEVKQ